MAGNVFITLTLFLMVTLNGVISMKTTPQHSVPHMCHASDESSEERCLQTPQKAAHPMQTPGVGALRASPFEVKYTMFNGDKRPYRFTYDTFETSEAKAKFNPVAPLKVLIHGFLNSKKTAFPKNVRDAYVTRMDYHPDEKYNVLVYDWGKGACLDFGRSYLNSAENVENAGKQLSRMLIKFYRMNLTDIRTKVHLIGHSLGSHVAGQAGRQVSAVLGRRLWRISALDPAGPYFWENKLFFWRKTESLRLQRNMANFLDVYHTSWFFGSKEKVGNVDFFINGGEKQSSCDINVKTPLFNIGITLPLNNILQVCAHMYATNVFAESINGIRMKACIGCQSYWEYTNGWCKCKDEVVMGEFAAETNLNGRPIEYGTAYINTPKDTSIGSNYKEMMKEGLFSLSVSAFAAFCSVEINVGWDMD